MAISTTQQIDYLWKKLGFGLAKTDIPANKTAVNESIISPPFMPGNEVWAEADLIPAVIPSANTPVVRVYTGANCVKCTMDITATTNRTWLTGLRDWIPILFGSTYQIKVYLDSVSATDPTITGEQLYAAGATPTSDDEWYFDNQAGVLHFIGTNLPNKNFTGKAIYISGARYVGQKGLHVASSGTFGNLSLAGDTISSTNTIVLSPTTANINLSNAVISNVGYSTHPNAAATVQYVTNQFATIQANSNIIRQGDSHVQVNDGPGHLFSNVVTVIDGSVVSTMSSGSFTLNGVSLNSSSTLTFVPAQHSLSVFNSTTALQLPTGTLGQRPASPYAGLMRFNSDTNTLEYHDGAKWISLRYSVDSQIIVGDGITGTFTLAHDATQTSILVIINGVVQQPSAYTVTGNTITFPPGDVPTPTEVVEIRYLNLGAVTGGPAVVHRVSLSGNNGIVVDTTAINLTQLVPTVVDVMSTLTYDCARYTVKASNSQTNEFQLSDISLWYLNNTVRLIVSSSEFSGLTELVTFNAQKNNNNIELIALSRATNTYVKIYKTYFTI